MIFQPIKNVYHSLSYNIKPLIIFELLYRLLGFFVIYPLIRLVFHLAIRYSGYRFITNNIFIDFLLKPSTMLFIFLLLVILSIYILIELTFLALLFDLGHKKEHIRFYDFLILGLKRVGDTFLKYHVLIIFPSFFFIFIVQAFHIVGVASTINIPDYIIAQINAMTGLSILLYLFVIVILILFIETIFSIHLFTIDRMTFKNAYRESRRILQKNRFRMIREFITINFVINVLLYFIYLIVILLIGGIISITRGQEYVLGFLLTVLYSTYSFIGLIASIILVPINFSLISTWYYAYKEKNGLANSREIEEIIPINPRDLKWIKRGTLLTLIILFLLNITTVFSLVLEPSDYVEALHQMEIVAHRGASKDAPENTIASIELAIEQGADVIEFDIQLTKDNVIVLMHDYTLRRTTNLTKQTRLADVTYDEIKNLDAGSWFSSDFEGEKIPTLIEVLSILGNRARLFIDIKTDSPILDEQLIQILELFDYVDHTVVLSKNRNQLMRLKALNPNIKTLLLISSFYGDVNQLANDSIVDYYGLEQQFVVNASAIIKELQSRGKKIYAWTVSEPSDMESILKYGLDGMITARPYIAREVIYSYRTQTSIVELLTQLFDR
jgi:glycerophosphoryl diester phosphodiesterase